LERDVILGVERGVWSSTSATRWSGAERRGGARRASRSELRARYGGVLPGLALGGGGAEPSE